MLLRNYARLLKRIGSESQTVGARRGVGCKGAYLLAIHAEGWIDELVECTK
jgi:hypothetical protein